MVSPGGAFLRSLVVPGWGHARLGAHGRGGFYIAADGGVAMMLFKIRSKLDHARRSVFELEALARDRLEREGVTDPLQVEAGIDADEAVVAARELVEAREGQREDWAALGIFLVLLGGVDAYVSGHLAGFPEPLGIGPGENGGVELSISLPVGTTLASVSRPTQRGEAVNLAPA